MEKLIVTLIVAGIGGFIGIKLKIPAGAMIGAMVFVAIYNIYTGKATIPSNFKTIAQVVVGGIIGLNFTIEAVGDLKEIIIPTIILVVALTLFSIGLGFFIHKVTGLDLMTALFSSSPGGLTDMAIISEAYGADTTKVVGMHLARLVTVIVVIPMLIKLLVNTIKP